MAKEWVVLYRGNRWTGQRPRRWLPNGLSTFWVLTGDGLMCMTARRYRGIALTARFREQLLTGLSFRNAVWRSEYPDMKKVKREERAAVRHLAALETEMFRDFMSILEHIALLQYEDGEPRQSGWLNLRVLGSAWQLTMKDPDSCSQITATGRTLDEAWIALALLLGSDSPPWEPDAFAQKQAARGKKK